MTEDPSALPQPADADRRQWPRADADWPVRLLLPEGHFEARVRDVSRAGLCFFLDRPIPEMTSLRLDLELPETELAAAEVISLPVHPALRDGDLETIVAAVNEG